MREFTVTTSVVEYLPDELPSAYVSLIERAKEQVEKAYAPYSDFRVGVSLLLDNGEIICGSNQENAAYPSGLCAERTAIFYANALYPDVPVVMMAVVAYTNHEFLDDPISPCGACRQVLLESEVRYDRKMVVLLYGRSKTYAIGSAKGLLPLCFEKKSLTHNDESV